MTQCGRFADSVALVTGGAGGIGGGISRRLAASGARVVVCDIDAAATEDMTREIAAAGDEALAVVGDITDTAVVDEVRTMIEQKCAGRLDIVVNNVGDFRPASRDFLHSTEEDWQRLYEVNLLHVLRVTHRMLPLMIATGPGAIVNNSTVEAFRGIPASAPYSAFNAGVSAFTMSLAVDLAQYRIRVNAIAPDLADTAQTPAAAMLRGRDPSMARSWVPLGRFGKPDDYAAVVEFLASDDARFITGRTIPVDGGTLAASGWYRRTDGKGWRNLPNEV